MSRKKSCGGRDLVIKSSFDGLDRNGSNNSSKKFADDTTSYGGGNYYHLRGSRGCVGNGGLIILLISNDIKSPPSVLVNEGETELEVKNDRNVNIAHGNYLLCDNRITKE